MNIRDFFFNRAGRPRSVWRFAVFAVVYLFLLMALGAGLAAGLALLFPGGQHRAVLRSNWGFVFQSVVNFTAAALAGWGCSLALEDLPWRALGWWRHRGWVRDLALGLLFGAASVGAAAALAAAAGGLRLGPNASAALWPAVLQTLLASAVIFLLGAAAEEMLFRGYPLQTLLRSWPAWVAVLPTSLPFALVHLGNPNVVPGFTLVNTALAGVWMGAAYVRTRSLWFPFALHFSWNWVMGALLGIPVSGITKIAPDPLLRPAEFGAAWLTGGRYGLEGGAACTLVLLLSTLFIWRTRLLSPAEELKALTDRENPRGDAAGGTLR